MDENRPFALHTETLNSFCGLCRTGNVRGYTSFLLNHLELGERECVRHLELASNNSPISPNSFCNFFFLNPSSINMRKFLRWAVGVAGIGMLIVSFVVYSSDFLIGFMLAFSGALIILLSLGIFGE